MDAKDYLKDYSTKADKYLDSFFKDKKQKAKKIDKGLVEILEVFHKYSKGGKKVRGGLTVLGYKAAGGKNLKDILPVSCGVELFHNFLLIHDDIIDEDDTRRGKPTIHKVYSKKKGEQYGKSKAIIIGDVGAFLAYELILSSNFKKDRLLDAVSRLNEFLLKTGYGQILDLEYDSKKKISWEEILKVRMYKTAYYTIVMPLSIGAMLSGADDKTLSSIENYGKKVGIAFQLQDDILGVFGESKKTGKSNTSDIYEGKKTLLYAKTLEMVDAEDKKFLKENYGVKGLTKTKTDKIKKIIKESGSLAYSEKKGKELSKEGKKYIENISSDKKVREILDNFADFIVTRDR